MQLKRAVGKDDKLEILKLESLKFESVRLNWKVPSEFDFSEIGKFHRSSKVSFQLEKCGRSWKVKMQQKSNFDTFQLRPGLFNFRLSNFSFFSDCFFQVHVPLLAYSENSSRTSDISQNSKIDWMSFPEKRSGSGPYFEKKIKF